MYFWHLCDLISIVHISGWHNRKDEFSLLDHLTNPLMTPNLQLNKGNLLICHMIPQEKKKKDVRHMPEMIGDREHGVNE